MKTKIVTKTLNAIAIISFIAALRFFIDALDFSIGEEVMTFDLIVSFALISIAIVRIGLYVETKI